MSFKRKLINQENFREDINLQTIEAEVDEILKKSNVSINSNIKKQIIDFVFVNLPIIQESINKNIDFDQIDILCSRAEDDLKIAKHSYEQNIFWAALYHLQQSIEKSVKAYGLFLGIIEDPRNEISHKTPKVYLKLLQLTWVDSLSEIIRPELNFQKSLSDLDVLLEKKIDLDKNIPFFLSLYKSSLEQIHRSFSNKKSKKLIKEVKLHCGINIKEIYMMQFEFAFLLYLFSFVTWIYAVEPRYSGEYEKLKIIQYFDEIIKLIEE